ncbi:MAG: hypothetical protein ACYTG7_15845 [Planctomycetota bacterium]|jgi:hypothetical protein
MPFDRQKRSRWFADPLFLCLLVLFALSMACASNDLGPARPLALQMSDAGDAFFSDLAKQGTMAQSYFTLFLPQDTVNKRHLLRFREEMEKSLRASAMKATMHYNASADRVFFLSKHKAEGWQPPANEGRSGEVLADEFRKGTHAGWTILHAFWGQYNRLIIGDDAWIQNLPESVRADLSHPLRYIVRVGVTLESSPNMATFVHRLQLSLVEVGKEKVVFTGYYPLVLSYPLL